MDKKEYSDIENIISDPQFFDIDKINTCLSNKTSTITILKENNIICLYIYKEYYKEHKEEIDNLIIKIIQNYKKRNISIEAGSLINDKLVEEICLNTNIKEISLAKYGFFDKYSLSKKHYELFKKANKEKIYSTNIDKDLEETFDPLIRYNYEKFLYSYYKYEDFQKDSVIIYFPIPEDKLYILKYLGENTKITLSTKCNIKEILETLKKYNKHNKIQIEIDDKVIFNQQLEKIGYFDRNQENFNNNIVVIPNAIKRVELPIKQYIEYEKLLYSIIKPAKNLSPFEKYIYAYDIVKRFKKYATPKKDNKNADNLSDSKYNDIISSSRDLYQILDNDYIVCVGFSNLLSDLLTKLGIDNIGLSVEVDLTAKKAMKQLNIPKDEWKKKNPEEKHKLITNQQLYIPKNDFVGHKRLLVNIKDDKYGIDGIYVSDPTWDNDIEKNLYTHALMTENDVSTSISTNKMNNNYLLFSATNIKEFYAMLNTLLDIKYRKRNENKDETKKNPEEINKENISDLYYTLNDFLEEFSKLFSDDYKKIEKKYSILQKSKYDIKDIYKIGEELQDLIYVVASIVSSKNNNRISTDKLKQAIEVVYKDAYEGGLRKEEINKMIRDTEEDSIIEFGKINK